MPGRGFAPDPDRSRIARRNKDHVSLSVVQVTPEAQPDLPPNIDWHIQTLIWWSIWGRSELAQDFTAVEWNYLTETAMLQNEFWNGDMKVASELRLRAAKFGATPEDRARLRIQVVTAQSVEDAAKKGDSPDGGARGRYAPPKAV